MSTKKLVCVGVPALSSGICTHLRDSGWDILQIPDCKGARRVLSSHVFGVGLFVCDIVDDVGCRELTALLTSNGNLEWVGCFGRASAERPACRDLILGHLFDHHTLPVDLQRLTSCLGHAYGRTLLRQSVDVAASPAQEDAIVARSAAMLDVLRQARRIASASAPVLIHGESGSGKELVALTVHRHSLRANGPFVAINCGAISSALIQSELFGHEKGSFTGAIADKRGLLEAAAGGTVFLDEIGDLPLDLQANLLRFLQDGTIKRVGSTRTLQPDVRVIAATNVDLAKAVAEGRFREDLFYRLNVLPLRVLPLRERREDIKPLAQHYFGRYTAEKKPRLKGFGELAIQAMEAYAWPGNVRELINRVRCAMIMADGKLIVPADLGLEAAKGPQLLSVLDDARYEAERGAIHTSLQHSGCNVTESARQLGVSRMTLYRLMVKHGISVSH